MASFTFTRSDTALVRLATGDDLAEALTLACKDLGTKVATVQVIGAVSALTLAYYHQDRKEYETMTFEGHWEIASAVGNVSLLEGEPFVHLHIVASGPDGACVGGHLVPGCVVFAAEAAITTLKGLAVPERELDGMTGLKLWR